MIHAGECKYGFLDPNQILGPQDPYGLATLGSLAIFSFSAVSCSMYQQSMAATTQQMIVRPMDMSTTRVIQNFGSQEKPESDGSKPGAQRHVWVVWLQAMYSMDSPSLHW